MTAHNPIIATPADWRLGESTRTRCSLRWHLEASKPETGSTSMFRIAEDLAAPASHGT